MLSIIALILALTVPFPITPEPELSSPNVVYEGFDAKMGIIATKHGVVGAGSNNVFCVDESGLVKKSLTSQPLKLKALVREEDVGLAVFTSPTELKLFEIQRDANNFNLTLRCRAETKDELVSSTKLVSGGLLGFKTKSGGLLLDAQNCKFKRFNGNFTLGLPSDNDSGIPFVHNSSTYLAQLKSGEIEFVKLNVNKSPCDRPVSKDGYVAIPASGELDLASLSSDSVKNVAQDMCGKSNEIFISNEIDALFLPIESGYALYKLSTATKRWDHIVPGSARLLGLFGQDLFWAYSFERDGKDYVNLFRFRHKNAQLYGRYPLESKASGQFAWSDKGFVALELDGRIAIYETVEIKPLLIVKIDAPLVEIVSHNGNFYALDSSGKLLVIQPKK